MREGGRTRIDHADAYSLRAGFLEFGVPGTVCLGCQRVHSRLDAGCATSEAAACLSRLGAPIRNGGFQP